MQQGYELQLYTFFFHENNLCVIATRHSIKELHLCPQQSLHFQLLLIRPGLTAYCNHGDGQIGLETVSKRSLQWPLNWVKINRSDVLFTKTAALRVT